MIGPSGDVALRLPRVRSLTSVTPTPVVKAELFVISQRHPKEENIWFSMGQPGGKKYSEAFWTDATNDLSIILFPQESKAADNLANHHQLLIYFATAQYHRWYLGLKSSVIFGATFAERIFRVFACWWSVAQVRESTDQT